MEAKIAAQDSLIRAQAAELAHSRKIFERASAVARIGVWECDLHTQQLTWTNVLYDIYDLPRGAELDRGAILQCYPEATRAELESVRAKAIEARSGFTLDTEIVTVKNNRRWVRITASVECEGGEPARIFGMKQDITEEKLLAERTRYLAEFDVMTGLANRSQFQARLAALARSGGAGALLLVDLDAFKQINDTYGHSFGDNCLIEAARRLQVAAAEADLVARIGGDEFAVLIEGRWSRAALERLAGRIVGAFQSPLDCGGETLAIGATVGIASAAACTPSELFVKADIALYAAKAAGRGRSQMFSADLDRRAIRAA
ncbi:diguanylate cyclase [Jiella sp. M17.18]|uniref:diguanylate cyclase domain-containing protein n=1 Tax=Jiella sp. M17.18 TaxID=3234247 RepID=UPI0034DE59BF